MKKEGRKEGICKVLSIILVRGETLDLRSRRDWVRYLLFPIFLIRFIKRRNDKVEFDTGCA